MKNINAFSIILLSTIVYSLVFSVGVIHLGKGLIYYILLIASFFSCFIGLCVEYRNNSFKQDEIDRDIRNLIKIYILWNLIIFILGIFDCTSFHSFARMILYPREGIYYLTPLFAYVVIDRQRIEYMYKCWIFYIILAIFYTYIFRNYITVTSMSQLNDIIDSDDLSIYVYFSIATLPTVALNSMAFFYIANSWRTLKAQCIVYMAILFAIICAMLLGRRSTIFSVFLFLSLGILLNLKNKPIKLILYFIFIGGLYCVWIFYESDILNAFPILFEKISRDTRSWAEEEFFLNFNGDYFSWILGRGAKATYYSPTYGFRSAIESGYLDLILHGGIIEVGLYILILLKAFYRGFFHSNNRMVNAMALFLLGQVFLLYPQTPIGFGVLQVVVWGCIIVCSTGKRRKWGLKYNNDNESSVVY